MHDLANAIQKISICKDLDTLQAVVTICTRDCLAADGTCLIFKEKNLCCYVDECAVSPLWKGAKFPIESCIGGWCMAHKEVVLIEDIRCDPRILQDRYAETFVQSLAIAPIRPDHPIAAIGVYWATQHQTSTKEVETLKILANATAVGLANVEFITQLNNQVMKRTAALLKAQKEAETANKTKSRFLSAASHDLRQPLQNISTLCAILSRKVDNTELNGYVDKIHKTIVGMDRLLSAILNLNQLESGNLQPNLRDFNLASLIVKLRQEFSEPAAAKGLQFSIPSFSNNVHSDFDLLLQILRNFLGNALKYTDDGLVSMECTVDNGTLNIGIHDSGPGIPEEFKTEIFDAFYRMDCDRQHKRGFGLGLAIVKGLAELMHHKITVTSTLGEGSTFSINVPISQTVHSDIIAQKKQILITAGPHRATVLYLEDDEDTIDAIDTLLSMEGYHVLSAQTGKQATTLMDDAAEIPDLLITDSRLADDENGLDVVKRLRSMSGRNIPAIMLTGYTEDSIHTKALETVQKILCKPVDADLLLKEIAELV